MNASVGTDNSKSKSPNIFNKARAMKASHKFSIHSEKNMGSTGNNSVIFKQTGEGIVNRDDGGNLIPAAQFA